MKNYLKKPLSLVIAIGLAFSLFICSFATDNAGKDGKGNGGGTGGGLGPEAPLKLEECNISDGMKNVDTDCHIVMRFTKNVSDLTVREQNEKGIGLTKSNGETVDYEVYFPDEFDNRRFIEINANLEPKTDYTLSLDQTIMARNGINYLWQSYEINFTTKSDGLGVTTIIVISTAVVVGVGAVILVVKKNKNKNQV